ncbi:transcription factor Cmr1, partial [Hortaea werneckii]
MVFCTYCGQSFTRDEHLERHILTHTNVKPFKCFTCHMSFARRDLLQRHYTVHGKDQNQEPIPAANGMIPKSAGRTPIACSNCAKTKTKCDKKFPCSRCAGRNLRCTLRPTRRSSKNAARMGVPPEGAVAIPPYTQQLGNLESGAVKPPPVNNSPPQQPHPLKPASPK